MIVRNEEENLGRCLQSVRDAVDEIIIVDTGSVDKTKEIARAFTAHVHDFEWCDDFSAARNAAFSYATKPFMMWMDADDMMENDAREKLCALKMRLDEHVDAVMMPYHCGIGADGKPSLVFERERIVRRGAGFFFSGAVHEAIALRGQVLHEPIPICHMGRHAQQSGRRNLAIYEKRMAEGQAMTPRDQYYYARELMACGETVRAEQAFALFLQMNGWTPNVIDAHMQRGECLRRLKRPEEAKSEFLAALSFGVPPAEALCALGDCMLEEGKTEAAAFWYRAALALEVPNAGMGFVNPQAYRYLPAIQLCVCLDRLGDARGAEEMNELALRYKPDDPSGLQNRVYFEQKRISKAIGSGG